MLTVLVLAMMMVVGLALVVGKDERRDSLDERTAHEQQHGQKGNLGRGLRTMTRRWHAVF